MKTFFKDFLRDIVTHISCFFMCVGKESTKNILIVGISLLITSCVSIAPPTPMLTYGGPEITPKKASELALGVGATGVRFEGAHNPAQGWFGRYKYGLNDKFDIGLDVMSATRNEGQYLGVKGALRYQLSKTTRLEFGIGGANDSDGKSLNGDFAFTMGTLVNKTWNYYYSLRYGYAHGFSGNAAFADKSTVSQTDTFIPPNTHFTVLNLGTQAKISEKQKFIIEGGYGYIFTKGNKSGSLLFISVGMLFTIGK